MNDFQTTSLHFNPPQSNSVVMTRWVLPAGQNILGGSIKVNNLKVVPDVPCNFPVQSGVYACVQRVQLLKNKKLVNTYTARSRTPPLLSALYGSNDAQKVLSVLSGTGNVVRFNPQTRKLKYERPVCGVDSAQLELRLLLDVLNHLTVINDEIEIIVSWIPQSRVKEAFVPVSPNETVSSFTFEDTPYLTFETLNGKEVKQPEKVIFNEYIEDTITIPQVAEGESQSQALSTNFVLGKTVNHLLVSTIPSSLVSLTPDVDAEPLFNLHTTQCSVPMFNEAIRWRVNGKDVFGNSNPNSAIKLAFFADVMKQKGLSPIAVSNAHLQTNFSPVDEIPDNEGGTDFLTGYYSYMGVQLNKRVNEMITIDYQRQGTATDTTFNQQLNLRVVAEVPVALVGDVKSYL